MSEGKEKPLVVFIAANDHHIKMRAIGQNGVPLLDGPVIPASLNVRPRI